MTPTTVITGKGKIPRAIRQLQVEAGRAIPGTVPGALVSRTARGILIQPDGASSTLNVPRAQTSKTARWL